MNSIVFDFCIICCIEIIGLIEYGSSRENDYFNAGSVYVLLFIPVILVALGLIQFVKSFVRNEHIWLSSLAPTLLGIVAIWLNSTFRYILLSCLLLVIIYDISKRFLRLKS